MRLPFNALETTRSSQRSTTSGVSSSTKKRVRKPSMAWRVCATVPSQAVGGGGPGCHAPELKQDLSGDGEPAAIRENAHHRAAGRIVLECRGLARYRRTLVSSSQVTINRTWSRDGLPRAAARGLPEDWRSTHRATRHAGLGWWLPTSPPHRRVRDAGSPRLPCGSTVKRAPGGTGPATPGGTRSEPSSAAAIMWGMAGSIISRDGRAALEQEGIRNGEERSN